VCILIQSSGVDREFSRSDYLWSGKLCLSGSCQVVRAVSVHEVDGGTRTLLKEIILKKKAIRPVSVQALDGT